MSEIQVDGGVGLNTEFLREEKVTQIRTLLDTNELGNTPENALASQELRSASRRKNV